MTMKKIFLAIACAALWVSCSDENTPPAPAPEHNRLEDIVDLSYPLIKEYHDNYGTYILYDFDFMKDFAYQFEQAGSWRAAEVQMLEPGDVQGALDYLENEFFPYYLEQVENEGGVMADTYFRESGLPRKILLCKEIVAGTLGITNVEGTDPVYHDVTASVNSFAISRLDAQSLSDMYNSATRKKEFRNNIHYMFLAGYLSNAKHIELADMDFYKVSQVFYGTSLSSDPQVKDYYERGFIRAVSLSPSAAYPLPNIDLRHYLYELINLTPERVTTLKAYPRIRTKSTALVKCLTRIGVDILTLNPEIKNLIN